MMELRTRNPNRTSSHDRQRDRFRRISWATGVCLLSCFLTGTLEFAVAQQFAVAQRQEEPAPERPVSNLSIDTDGDRYLMLQNGNVFHGKIEKVEHKWKVTINQGTSLLLENHKVRVIADSLEDIYFYQSQRISPYDAQLRVELIRWCLRNKLVQQAQAEMKQLETLRIDPQIRNSLTFQLKQQTDPKQIPSIAASLKASSEQLARNRQTAPLEKTLPVRNQSPLQMADAGATVSSPLVPARSNDPHNDAGSLSMAQHRSLQPAFDPATTPARNLRDDQALMQATPTSTETPVASVFNIYNIPGAQPTPEAELALKNSLPQSVVQQFSDQVHSVIVDSCAGCHFEGNPEMEGTSFSLQLVSQQDPSASVRHNLQQIVKLINRKNPGNSELLGIATQAHGGLGKPPLPEDPQLQELLSSWVFSTRADAVPPSATSSSKVMLAGAQTEVPAHANRLQPAAPTLPEPNPPQGLMPAAPLGIQSHLNPQNPFDPSVFNQLHGTAPQPSADPPAATAPTPTTPADRTPPSPPATRIPRPTSLFQLESKTQEPSRPLGPSPKIP